LEELFPDLSNLWKIIPELFSLRISDLGKEFANKLRKYYSINKNPGQIKAKGYTFKIQK